MEKKKAYQITSIILYLIGATWAVFAFGWQLLGVLFFLAWSFRVEDLSNKLEITRKPPKQSVFHERLEELRKEKEKL